MLDAAPSMFSAAVLPWLQRHVPVLDPQRPRRGSTLSYSQTSPAAKIPGTERLERRGAAHAARVSRAPARPRAASITSGIDAGADRRRSRTSSSSPLFGHDPRHALAVALEALELLAAVDLDPVLLEHVLEEAPDLVAEDRSKRHVLEHHDACSPCRRPRSATPRPRSRCSCRRSAPPARRLRRRRGSRRSCRSARR